MISHSMLTDRLLWHKIRHREIILGGNAKLKIYGTLHCASGKRMKRENRVFFRSEEDAITHGYRPCAHCMRHTYQKWKNGLI
ncbi:Ada metal-binding domain-containing protein [Xanthocytophaga agilis]|uniref:Ada metal-binding domain-containing protein n=1 Tax=Xanthocytophaga agilis TaxID=3048010 RepID=A0AAE3RC07_9BACT|nr:Ada metal-binding domain-containing protein [Xanthocytophaga agilis]MDJ1504728.1 Ada metal-binding domain-containing protein [Xanthocytophaga agilis]